MKIQTSTVLLLTAISLSGMNAQGTLAQCQDYAKKFANTCTSGPATWTSFTGATVSCTQEACPTGGGTAPNCAWTRKLCVTCSSESNKIFIRIQSNGLPNHCYGGRPTVVETVYDMKMVFDPTIPSTPQTTFASQQEYDDYVCMPGGAQTRKIPATSSWQLMVNNTVSWKSMDGIIGFATNGLPIFAGASAERTDPYYPQAWSGSTKVQAEVVDACIGHPQGDGLYHYHMLPPCLVNANKLQTTKVCEQVSYCASDLKNYALDSYTQAAKNLTYLGIAKDGRPIVGPYDSTGSLIDCSSLDQCGGMQINNQYVYVFQNKKPYAFGCFGPGEAQKYQASCSSNTCGSSFAITQLQQFIALMIGVISAFNIFSY
eukprot:403354286